MPENSEDRGDFLDDVDEISDKEQLEQDILDAEAYVEASGNIWAFRALQLLKAEYAKLYFDEDGNEIEIPPSAGGLARQYSPVEVLEAEGWWIAPPTGFTPSRRNRFKKVDLSEGLKISNSRSNGGFLIYNVEETAKIWMENPQKVSKALGFRASPRLILLAGTMLRGRRFVLPAFHAPGASGLGDYSLKPEVPFNEDEARNWYRNFKTYQRQGSLYMAGALRQRSPVRDYSPDLKIDKEATDVDPANGKHIIPIWTNRPDWIMVGTMQFYNSSTFKRDIYAKARRLAFQIDAGAARVPGYTHPTEWGAEEGRAGLEKWYARFESTGGRNRPAFRPGVIEL